MYDTLTTLERLMLLYKLKGGGGTELTVTGNPPLTLANSTGKDLISLLQYGKVTQASTPTPSSPVDIVCNNGTLKVIDDELPTGYKRVLGFTCDNNAMWQITGFKLKGSDTVRVSFSIDAACNVWGCYQGTDATDNYDLYASVSAGSKYLRYGNGVYLSYWSPTNLGKRFDTVVTPTGTSGMPQDSTWTAKTFTAANDLLIGSTTVGGTSAKLKGNLYGSFVVDGRLNAIPCERVSDGTLGYYDTYSETFYEPYTGYTGAVSLGYDGSHYSLAVVGTPEVLSLAPVGSATQDGTPTPDNYVPVVGTKMGNTELLAIDTDADAYDPSTQNITRVIGKKVLDGTETFGKSTAYGLSWYITSAAGAWGATKTKAVMCTHFVGLGTQSSGQADEYTCFFNGSGHFYFRASEFADAAAFKAWVKNQYDAGTPIVVYFVRSSSTTETYTGTPVGGTASAVDLFAVGDYKDAQEIISGTATRNVGVRMLTGADTEGWTRASSNDASGNKVFYINFPNRAGGASSLTMLCDHYQQAAAASYTTLTANKFLYNPSASNLNVYFDGGSSSITVDEWKNRLAYDPIIVVYPLAEATTEQVTAQPLHTVKGDNVTSVVSNVDPVTLDVVYKGKEAA